MMDDVVNHSLGYFPKDVVVGKRGIMPLLTCSEIMKDLVIILILD